MFQPAAAHIRSLVGHSSTAPHDSSQRLLVFRSPSLHRIYSSHQPLSWIPPRVRAQVPARPRLPFPTPVQAQPGELDPSPFTQLAQAQRGAPSSSRFLHAPVPTSLESVCLAPFPHSNRCLDSPHTAFLLHSHFSLFHFFSLSNCARVSLPQPIAGPQQKDEDEDADTQVIADCTISKTRLSLVNCAPPPCFRPRVRSGFALLTRAFPSRRSRSPAGWGRRRTAPRTKSNAFSMYRTHRFSDFVFFLPSSCRLHDISIDERVFTY